MGSSHLIDTNVIIELLANRLPLVGRDYVEQLLAKRNVATSVINRMELLSFTGPESELQMLKAFLATVPILPLTEEIVLATIRVRRRRKIKLPDAIIAATALTHNLTLLSRNSRDFSRVEALEHLNPHEL